MSTQNTHLSAFVALCKNHRLWRETVSDFPNEWPEPNEIPPIIRVVTHGMTDPPGAYWLTLPVWSAPEAGWLAVGIDPHQVMPPTWRIPGPRESREATAREGVAVITARLIAAVGERGSPADYVRAIRSLGIHPEWMGDHCRVGETL